MNIDELKEQRAVAEREILTAKYFFTKLKTNEAKAEVLQIIDDWNKDLEEIKKLLRDMEE